MSNLVNNADVRCACRESKQKLHVVQFKLSIALKLLLSVFLELTAVPAGEVIQHVPAAAHIRAEQLYNYYVVDSIECTFCHLDSYYYNKNLEKACP